MQGLRWFWRSGGECFGYAKEGALFTYRGLQIGEIRESDIYGADGFYLGQIQQANRLLTTLAKLCLHHDGFFPTMDASFDKLKRLPAIATPIGFQDFRTPDFFHSKRLLFLGGFDAAPATSPQQTEMSRGA